MGRVVTALCYITLHNFFKSVLMVTRGSVHLVLNMLFHNILFCYTQIIGYVKVNDVNLSKQKDEGKLGKLTQKNRDAGFMKFQLLCNALVQCPVSFLKWMIEAMFVN